MKGVTKTDPDFLNFTGKEDMEGVIIAAGNSTRLWPETNRTPKTLLPFGQGTILSHIMDNLAHAGVSRFIIILGFEADHIVTHLEQNNYFGHSVEIVINPDYHRGNGLSVLKAEEALRGDQFILSMSDHLVSSSAVARVLDSEADKNLLLVDRQTERIFDIDDATKVLCQDRRILKINKTLQEYNGIDCGIFRLNRRFFEAMRQQEKQGKESISAGVEQLIASDDMEAVFMLPQERWIDIDTPAAYNHALKTYLPEPVLSR